MVILVDTRQKHNQKNHKAKEEYFENQGYTVVKSKLVAGDYMLPTGDVSCDTKKDCGELYSNLIQDHERFRNECILAQKCGIKLVVLVENEDGFTKPDDIMQWKNPQMIRWWRSGKKGKPPAPNMTILKIMCSMNKKYGVDFRFCATKDAGRQIIAILTEGKRNNGNL